MAGPDSSYSCLEHHRFWKVEREAKMDPPIQTEYFLSGGATILTCSYLIVSLHGPDTTGKPTNLHARRGESGELLLHTVGDTREHGGTTRQDDVSVQITTDIEIALVDRIVSRLVDAVSFETEHGRLKEGLGSTESVTFNE